MTATHYVASTEIGTEPCWPTRASSYTGTMVQHPRLQEIRFDDLLQLLTAVLGTKPTSKPVRRMSAIRGKPDVTQTCSDDRL